MGTWRRDRQTNYCPNCGATMRDSLKDVGDEASNRKEIDDGKYQK